MASNERQTRFCRCVICQKEGEVEGQYSQKEIIDQHIPYSGAYTFNRICTDCLRLYANPNIQVNWNIEHDELCGEQEEVKEPPFFEWDELYGRPILLHDGIRVGTVLTRYWLPNGVRAKRYEISTNDYMSAWENISFDTLEEAKRETERVVAERKLLFNGILMEAKELQNGNLSFKQEGDGNLMTIKTGVRTFSDNAVKFYLNSSYQERWAIRHFLTADSNVMSDADFLLNLEGYFNKRAEAIEKGYEKLFKIKPEYEKYVHYTDQRIIL